MSDDKQFDKNYLLTVERIDEFRREQHIPPQPGDQDWIAEENAALDAICAAAKAHLSATLQIPEGWKLVPTRATEEWARDFLSGVLNEDRHTRSKIEGVEDDINNVLGVAPSYVGGKSA